MMKKLIPLTIAFGLGMITAILICTAIVRHVDKKHPTGDAAYNYIERIAQLEMEKTWLGQKIAFLVLQVSPDIRESGKEIFIGKDGGLEIKQKQNNK